MHAQQNALLLRLTNVSRAGCALRGYPGVALSGSNGVLLRLQTCIARQTVLARRIRVIPPGERRPVAAVLSSYPELGYCGPGDPGHVIDVSPVEPTMQAVYADRA